MPAGPSTNTRAAVIERDGLWCRFCLRQFPDAEHVDLTLDHLIPRSRGGSNTVSNLVVSCRRCNQAKGPAMVDEIGWFLFPPRYLEGRSLDNLTPELRDLRSHCLQWSAKRSQQVAPSAGPESYTRQQDRLHAEALARSKAAAAKRRTSKLTQRPFADLKVDFDPVDPPDPSEYWKADYWVRVLGPRTAEVLTDAEWEAKRKAADVWNAGVRRGD